MPSGAPGTDDMSRSARYLRRPSHSKVLSHAPQVGVLLLVGDRYGCVDEDLSLHKSLPIADARFEILGSPFSLLSASISASQDLYTRKGTLAGFNGKAENVRRRSMSMHIDMDNG